MRKWFYITVTFFAFGLVCVWLCRTETGESLNQQQDQQGALQNLAVNKKPVPAREGASANQSFLKGRVIDSEGRPLEGVAIQILLNGGSSESSPTYFSDNRGFFHISRPNLAGESLLLTASGFQNAVFEIMTVASDPLIVMTPTTRNQTQVIRIVDEKGEPIHQAKVVSHPGGPLDASLGEISIDNFPYIRKIDIHANGFVGKTITEFGHFKNPQTIVLARTWILRGCVRDRQSGDPIEHCQLRFEQQGQVTSLDIVTQNGFFSVPALHEEMNLIEIKAWEYPPYPIDSLRNDAIKTRSDDIHYFDLGDTIFRGKVLDPQGNPMEHAVVHFLYVSGSLLNRAKKSSYLRDREKYLHTNQTFSSISFSEPHYSGVWRFSKTTWPDFGAVSIDKTGSYTYKVESEDAKLDLLVDAEGYQPFFLNRADKIFARNQGYFDIQLQRYATMRVEVGQVNSPEQRHILVEDSIGNEYKRILKQGDTHFEIDKFPKGRARLFLYGVNDGGVAFEKGIWGISFPVQGVVWDRTSIVVVPGKHHSLRLGFNTRHLGGRVFWDGEPLGNQALEIYPITEKNDKHTFTTDHNGSFIIERLPQAIYEIRLLKNETSQISNLHHSFAIDLQENQDDVTLDFFSSGSVFGQVLGPPKGSFLELTHIQKKPWYDLFAIAEHRDLVISGQFIDPNPNIAYYRQEPETHVTNKTRIPLDSTGEFRFKKIPPGWVNLTLHLEERIYTLVHSAVMPSSGQDLDLGKLELDNRGTLELVFAGGERFANEELEIELRGSNYQFHFPEVDRIFSRPVGPPLVMEMPKGPLEIWVFSEEDEWSGFEIKQPIRVQIEPRKTTRATVELVPLTLLSISGDTIAEVGDLTVDIRNLDSGTHFQIKNKEELKLGTNSHFATYYEHDGVHSDIWFTAERVPEGYYRIDFYLSNKRARFFVYLQAGKPLDIDLKPADFVWLQP